MKEGEFYEMESNDDGWGSFREPGSHKFTWLKQAGGLGSGWSQGPFWPLIWKCLRVVGGWVDGCPVFCAMFQLLERKSDLNDQDKVLALLDDVCLPLEGIEPREYWHYHCEKLCRRRCNMNIF